MTTVSDVARLFDISKQSARGWSAEFGDYLSPAANPPAGHARRFDEVDLAVFALVAEMRAAGANYADIHAALASGQRGQPPAEGPGGVSEPAPDEPEPAGSALVPLQMLEQFAVRLDAQYRDRLDRLEVQLEDERAARLGAERRAVAAETELQVLRELGLAPAKATEISVAPELGPAEDAGNEGAASSPAEAVRRPWYRRLWRRSDD
jgi:DNA-binding transcriptional MerR regulator